MPLRDGIDRIQVRRHLASTDGQADSRRRTRRTTSNRHRAVTVELLVLSDEEYKANRVYQRCDRISSGCVTRDLYRKCSGEESRSERRTSVRSTFDKAVCSEPLAFAADAGLWELNGRYALLRVWKR